MLKAILAILSDIHECLGDLLMASPRPVKQVASCKSPHDWLARLAMELLCVHVVCEAENVNNSHHIYDMQLVSTV